MQAWEKHVLIVDIEMCLGVLLATSINVKFVTNLCELQVKNSGSSDQCDCDSDCDSKFINKCAHPLVTSQMFDFLTKDLGLEN